MAKFLGFLPVLVCVLSFTDACPNTIKNAFNPDDTIKETGCYYADGMFIDADSGTSADIENAQPQKCHKFCAEKGYSNQFVILQYETCHCNKAFRRHAKRDASKCDVDCRGSHLFKCGGKGFASGYYL
ncbi:hypothetical protein BOX15_Mlig014715g1 [Macrostomum lignano]|uniref:WSC domain-containing protein n=1 Tax=Macrostomum lignano TaxID=282301 RepID=A0A267H0Z1_9PLAT|nr:hypothetical protein BOX15_Mlig014715g1 [Macrostomum lignano]